MRIPQHIRQVPQEQVTIALCGADDGAALGGLRDLFQEYAQSLGIDLGFQNFAAELESLPHPYAAPHGALFFAMLGDDFAGCCAMRALASSDYPDACEMKRLYVRPAFRGMGIGRQLTEAILEAARLARYRCILLDTLDNMESARSLYDDLGFEEIPPYYYNPIAGAHYLKARL